MAHLDHCDCYLCGTQTTWAEVSPNLPEENRVPPRDVNRILNYLLPKSQGKEPACNVVHTVSFEQQDPEILYYNLARQWKNELYLFTRNVKKNGSGSRFERRTERGEWKPSGGKVAITLRSGEVIGYRKKYKFVDTLKGKTNWRMKEYRFNRIKQYGDEEDQLGDLVLRVIQLKDEKQYKYYEQGNVNMHLIVWILLMVFLLVVLVSHY